MNAYVITNNVNGKKYVGIAKTPHRRWRKHLCSVGAGETMLQRAMAKHGPENFTFEVVACATDWGSLCEIEKLLIAQYSTFCVDGSGYNMTKGGDGTFGTTKSPATRQKIGSVHKGRKLTPEHRAKLSAAKKGCKVTDKQREVLDAYRNKCDPEKKREKLRAARTGVKRAPPPPETRAKMSLAHTGRKHTQASIEKMKAAQAYTSPEVRKKISLALLGRSYTEETIKKMSEGQRRRFARQKEVQTSMDNVHAA